jgi:hypothetical protein
MKINLQDKMSGGAIKSVQASGKARLSPFRFIILAVPRSAPRY